MLYGVRKAHASIINNNDALSSMQDKDGRDVSACGDIRDVMLMSDAHLKDSVCVWMSPQIDGKCKVQAE